jgi:quinol monooxygenase YgiN
MRLLPGSAGGLVILVTLNLAPPPGGRQEMIDVFWLIMGPVQAQPGCLCCSLYQEVGEGDHLLYMEAWDTQEQLERHMRSARYERLLSVMDSSIKQPVLRYQTISAVKGLEYLEAVRMGSPLSPPGPNGDEHEDKPQ